MKRGKGRTKTSAESALVEAVLRWSKHVDDRGYVDFKYLAAVENAVDRVERERNREPNAPRRGRGGDWRGGALARDIVKRDPLLKRLGKVRRK